jgi:hypothetical protein
VNEPMKEDWSALYQTAIAFQQAAPWKWVDNEGLFAVENPDDGEVAYCAILGSGGEEFGLGISLGQDGYERYTKLMADEGERDDFEENIMMRGMGMFFVDRDVLQKEDSAIIRSLGLSFRGRNAWPFFRSQRPGYVPWFLEKQEVLFFTTAIDQALVVADEVRCGKLDLLKEQPDNLILTRLYRDAKWHEEWRKVPKLGQEPEARVENIDLVKEAELHLLASRAGALSGRWELDIFLLPMPIGPKSERPYFPLCFFAVETKQGMVLGVNLTEPWLTFSERQDEVIQILRKVNQLPIEIRVKSNEVKKIVEPIASILGIKIRIVSLPMLEQAKAGVDEYLSGRRK